MLEERKFEFVYNKRTKEDEEFIKSLEIYSEFHNEDITRSSYTWTADKTNGMYLIYNDIPNVRFEVKMTEAMCVNFIYKNQANLIIYDRIEDEKNKIWHIKLFKVKIHESLIYEKEYVLEAIREAIRVYYENGAYHYKCVFENINFKKKLEKSNDFIILISNAEYEELLKEKQEWQKKCRKRSKFGKNFEIACSGLLIGGIYEQIPLAALVDMAVIILVLMCSVIYLLELLDKDKQESKKKLKEIKKKIKNWE